MDSSFCYRCDNHSKCHHTIQSTYSNAPILRKQLLSYMITHKLKTHATIESLYNLLVLSTRHDDRFPMHIIIIKSILYGFPYMQLHCASYNMEIPWINNKSALNIIARYGSVKDLKYMHWHNISFDSTLLYECVLYNKINMTKYLLTCLPKICYRRLLTIAILNNNTTMAYMLIKNTRTCNIDGEVLVHRIIMQNTTNCDLILYRLIKLNRLVLHQELLIELLVYIVKKTNGHLLRIVLNYIMTNDIVISSKLFDNFTQIDFLYLYKEYTISPKYMPCLHSVYAGLTATNICVEHCNIEQHANTYYYYIRGLCMSKNYTVLNEMRHQVLPGVFSNTLYMLVQYAIESKEPDDMKLFEYAMIHGFTIRSLDTTDAISRLIELTIDNDKACIFERLFPLDYLSLIDVIQWTNYMYRIYVKNAMKMLCLLIEMHKEKHLYLKLSSIRDDHMLLYILPHVDLTINNNRLDLLTRLCRQKTSMEVFKYGLSILDDYEQSFTYLFTPLEMILRSAEYIDEPEYITCLLESKHSQLYKSRNVIELALRTSILNMISLLRFGVTIDTKHKICFERIKTLNKQDLDTLRPVLEIDSNLCHNILVNDCIELSGLLDIMKSRTILSSCIVFKSDKMFDKYIGEMTVDDIMHIPPQGTSIFSQILWYGSIHMKQVLYNNGIEKVDFPVADVDLLELYYSPPVFPTEEEVEILYDRKTDHIVRTSRRPVLMDTSINGFDVLHVI